MFSRSYRWVVTGGAGFIGSHVVKELVRLGQQVTVVDNLSSGSSRNLEEVEGQIQLVRADIRRASALKPAFDGADFVCHYAALVSVAQSVQEPEETMSVNVHGTENVLEAALQAGVKKMIFASSSAVYGNSGDVPYTESSALDFRSPYALSKYMGEKLCRHYTEVFGLHVTLLRGFNVFGPGQNTQTAYGAVVAKFMQAAKEEDPLPICGDGSQIRDFIYVEDAVQACLLAMQKGGAGETYNVASGQTCSLLELAKTFEQVVGHALKKEFLSARAGDVAVSQADISKLRALGFSPRVSLVEGLRRTWEAY